MKFGIVFLLLGLVSAFNAWQLEAVLPRLVAASAAVCFTGVGLGFLMIGPRVFLKRSTGQLSVLSYVLFWPYHLLNNLALSGISRKSRENVMDEIAPNLFLGRRLTGRDTMATEQFVAVLDLTSEFARSRQWQGVAHYKCIPLLDTFPPTTKQLTAGVEFLASHINAGPVYVHCAMGHGRSATFVAAYLLATGVAGSVENAERLIHQKRPRIGFYPRQRQALQDFKETYRVPT